MNRRQGVEKDESKEVKNQLQPMLEGGKRRGNGVALSDLQML